MMTSNMISLFRVVFAHQVLILYELWILISKEEDLSCGQLIETVCCMV